jgi:hypothetical protein
MEILLGILVVIFFIAGGCRPNESTEVQHARSRKKREDEALKDKQWEEEQAIRAQRLIDEPEVVKAEDKAINDLRAEYSRKLRIEADAHWKAYSKRRFKF